MTRRFQIEDLIVQDATGVTFRALDTHTGKTVALRRFFPFGANGGGLFEEEMTAYNIALGRLAGVSHPALRSVICGGCDPVDGMPFIATEWIEGQSLKDIVAQAPLSVEFAAQVIGQVLEVCELLSVVLSEEAIWVSTELQTIIVANKESGRGATFRISPLKWLGGGPSARGLESIVTFTEEIMGWKGRIISEQAGGGLGAWCKWLRTTAATSLAEVRNSLAVAIGAEPPVPVTTFLATVAPAPVKEIESPPSKTHWILILLILIALAGAGGIYWMWGRSANPAPNHPLAEDAPSAKADLARINQRAAELSALAAQARQPQPNPPITPDGVIPWNRNDLLVPKNKQLVIIEGTFETIAKSQSGKTLYLLFSKRPNPNDARASIEIGVNPPAPVIASLEPLRGKKVRITGIVSVCKSGGLTRPDIVIMNASAIKAVE